jgi:hypothetical protein
MNTKSNSHDINGAMLFLETFPEILRNSISGKDETLKNEIEELLEIYQVKIGIIKKAIQK